MFFFTKQPEREAREAKRKPQPSYQFIWLPGLPWSTAGRVRFPALGWEAPGHFGVEPGDGQGSQ